MRLNRGLFLAAACAVACLVVAQGRASQAVRTLSGHVVDSANQPLYKAVVYLKNTKTLVIRTYITEKDGSYRFSALSPNVDYEVYANHQGDRSETKTLSGFDNRRQVDFTLRIRGK